MDSLQIFLAAQPELLRYAARITGDSVEAEDVVQEAWLRFRATATARALEEPNGYLFRIVQNLALDRQRRLGRENRLFSSDTDTAAALVANDQPSQHDVSTSKEEMALLRDALLKLPYRSRRAFEMHRFEEMKLTEIAQALGISKSVASELVIDAVEFCKKALRRGH